ncbi:integrase [Microbacterium sp. HSID17254]|uniref:tyrosine-type recombinase/integrase n=1 Tax=Microbacterium sp. HSID17254 TaxID=2419509 RepID=UPI000F89674B|nr:tyrosine-type recombinase/integrase [Microbacterium sp. HSID17254]RUQ07049.1 integrase [Microbacterium sp. HSID17254]
MPKKRSHGDGGLFYVKSRGLWRGVIDDGFHPDGRRRQRTVTGKTRMIARDKLVALRKEIDAHGAPLDKAVTVEAWAEHWLRTVCEPSMKPAALAGYESAVRKWILPVLRKKRVSALKPSDVRTVTQSVTAAGRAVSSAQKVHAVLSSMLEAARMDGVCAKNVAQDVTPPGRGEGGRGALDTDVALRVLQAALNRPDGSRWWFAILTGMRQGERLGATLDSADLARHEFTVQWSLTEVRFRHGCNDTCGKTRAGACLQRRLIVAPGMTHRQLDGRLCLVRPKSGNARTFPLIPALEDVLTTYLAGDTRPNPHGLIWRNDDGSPITPEQDQAEWRSLLLEAGVITPEQALPPRDRPAGTPETPTTHFARHTTATVLMELGVDAKVIGEIVGHMDVRTTRGYQHVSSAEARRALEALGAHFAGALAR